MSAVPRVVLLLLLNLAGAASARAWDYEGHRIVNQVALAALPAEFPGFVRAASSAERIAFLAGEADRWRNVADAMSTHANAPEHFFDFEDLDRAGLPVAALPSLRYAFATQFAEARAARAGRFPALDPARNADRTREWPGFLPWAIAEHYHRLRSAFAYLRAFEEGGGTRDEIANAQANVVHLMGVMGHFVGDGAQPLHTTIHFNGWVGPNPQGFTTANSIHAWIDSGFLRKAGVTAGALVARARPASALAVTPRADGRDPVFVAALDYLRVQHGQVETLYRMEREGRFNRDERPADPQGRAFLEARLLAGGQMLASIWVTAWRTAPVDTFLQAELARRSAVRAGRN